MIEFLSLIFINFALLVRVKLCEAMGGFCIPNKLIRLTRMTVIYVRDVRNRIKENGSLSREFRMNNGQGDTDRGTDFRGFSSA